ncbi:hypothetical protein QVG61_04600 [Thiohalobacter sp. IOR34]|uniref:hypothetical protein n=1 Tax=Thiohalobacter sp. IOR34 TaxID=3057176 RepID=UPI0025B0CECC|nr:hypothetical protein [Thiohalobacter sp. IOR34]WJW76379.1 hypothetical protein QVG61_04600 [Thiohalobacter sp. IOR34]
MRRLISHLLIFCLLATSSAWALDFEDAGLSEHGACVFSQDDPGHDNPGAEPGCNHLCHAGAHLLGALLDNAAPAFGSAQPAPLSRLLSLASRPKDPPTHPPQI